MNLQALYLPSQIGSSQPFNTIAVCLLEADARKTLACNNRKASTCYIEPRAKLIHGLRELWEVGVPMQLDFPAARGGGPSAATRLRMFSGFRAVLVCSLQT